MQKTQRLLAIERILIEEKIFSQVALLKKLKGRGIVCTQATLSRNLRQLGVSRIPDSTGHYRYFIKASNGVFSESGIMLNFVPVVHEIIEAKGLMIIKTMPGNANATAYFIDNSGRYEIAATIAGDDTILVIPRDGITMSQVHYCLEIIMPGLHKQIEGTNKNPKGKKLKNNKIIK